MCTSSNAKRECSAEKLHVLTHQISYFPGLCVYVASLKCKNKKKRMNLNFFVVAK